MELSSKVKTDIKDFLTLNMADFYSDAIEYDGLDITFATNDNGDTWNYQTGDNSYTGNCYSLPHWSVSTIYTDTPLDDLYSDIIDQLTELLPENK